jgi:3-isopropylmalate/(R)-2-methylmalate dehydratase small subunit
MVCPVLSGSDIEYLMKAIETDPGRPIRIDLQEKVVRAGDATLSFEMPESARQQFLQGHWDSTAGLLDGRDQVLEKMKTIPYFSDFTQ